MLFLHDLLHCRASPRWGCTSRTRRHESGGRRIPRPNSSACLELRGILAALDCNKASCVLATAKKAKVSVGKIRRTRDGPAFNTCLIPVLAGRLACWNIPNVKSDHPLRAQGVRKKCEASHLMLLSNLGKPKSDSYDSFCSKFCAFVIAVAL